MKVLIFEGIATSGKSTVVSELEKTLVGLNTVVLGEDGTHLPIIQKISDKHIEFFESLISNIIDTRPEILMFDRLYLTQAFRAKCGLDDYVVIEEMLSYHSACTFFFKVDEDKISQRISEASKHRGANYFKSRGSTSEEIAKYYVDQQRSQLELLKQSKLPYRVIDTTGNNYGKVVEQIVGTINQSN